MVRRKITIYNNSGLHLRPAGQLCRKAMEFQSSIQMVVGEKSFNLKSVLSVLSAQITTSREIELVCHGADEEQAMEAVARLLAGNLDEA